MITYCNGKVERKYTKLMATVHADATEILVEIEKILVRERIVVFVGNI